AGRCPRRYSTWRGGLPLRLLVLRESPGAPEPRRGGPPEGRLLDLPRAGARERGLLDHEHVPRHLVAGERGATEGAQRLGVRGRPRYQDDEGRHVLAARWVGHAHHV